jgi:16S rRNA processing protein RimM
MELTGPEFIAIGEILSPWGTEGQLKIRVITDFPERFSPLSSVYIKHKPMTIRSAIWQKDRVIIKLDSIDSYQKAKALQGQLIEIHHSQLKPLPDGQYYHFQLIGLEVRTTNGESLGNISQVLVTTGNDVYVVEGSQGDILIPAVEGVVKSIDIKQGHMIIEAIEGLLSLNITKSG